MCVCACALHMCAYMCLVCVLVPQVCVHMCVHVCIMFVWAHMHVHIQGQYQVFFSLSPLFRDRTTHLVLTDTARLAEPQCPPGSASSVLCSRTHHYAWLLHSC